jgi:hypothetical protein
VVNVGDDGYVADFHKKEGWRPLCQDCAIKLNLGQGFHHFLSGSYSKVLI